MADAIFAMGSNAAASNADLIGYILSSGSMVSVYAPGSSNAGASIALPLSDYYIIQYSASHYTYSVTHNTIIVHKSVLNGLKLPVVAGSSSACVTCTFANDTGAFTVKCTSYTNGVGGCNMTISPIQLPS